MTLAFAVLCVGLPLAAALDAFLAGALPAARGALWVATAGTCLFAIGWVGTRPRRGSALRLDDAGLQLPRLGSARLTQRVEWSALRALSERGWGPTRRWVFEAQGRVPFSLARAAFERADDYAALGDDVRAALSARLGADARRAFDERSALSARYARPLMPVTGGIVAVISVAFVTQLAWRPLAGGADWLDLGGASWPLLADGHFDRLYTSMWLHAGAQHFLFNAAALWGLGWSVERWLGSARCGLLFACVTPLAALLGSFFEPGRVYLGASALGYALLGVWAGLLLRRRPLPAPLAQPAWIAVALTALLLWDLLLDLGRGGGASTAWASHGLGLALGLGFGVASAGQGARDRPEPGPGARLLTTALLAAAVVACGAGLLRIVTTSPEARLATVERVLQAGRISPPLRLRLALAMARHPDSDPERLRRARRELHALEAAGLRHVDVWRGLISAHERLGEWDDAVSAALAARRALPRSRAALRELARMERARIELGRSGRAPASALAPRVRLAPAARRDRVRVVLSWDPAPPEAAFVLHALAAGPDGDSHWLEFRGAAGAGTLAHCPVERAADLPAPDVELEASWFEVIGPVRPTCRLWSLR